MDTRSNAPLTVDGILVKHNKILLIKRKSNTFDKHLALPGGFVNFGERVEDAIVRELKEELNLNVIPKSIIGVYSGSGRDPRGPVITVVFTCQFKGEPQPGDDAADYTWRELSSVKSLELAFDHKLILQHYKHWRVVGGTYWSTKRLH